MLLIKRICQTLNRPVFEVMAWPADELEYWSIFFSIDDNKDKPIVTVRKAEHVSVEESKSRFKNLFG